MSRNRNAPPGPDGLPLVGNTLSVVRDQGGFYRDVNEKYGGVASLSVLGLGDLYLLTDPEYVQRMLTTDHDSFVIHPMVKEQFGDLVGNGLVVSSGEFWERQHELIRSAFTPDRIESYVDDMRATVRETVEGWEHGETYDIESEMKSLTLRILLASMFGVDLDIQKRGISDALDALYEPGKPHKQPVAYLVPHWVPIPMWRRYDQAIDQFDALVEEMISQRRENGYERDDLLTTLLTVRDDDGERMADEQVRDELMTLLFAGHETSATALTFAFYLLTANPQAFDRLRAEFDAVLDGDLPTLADVPELTYADRVIKETLRLYPPIPMLPRATTEDVTFGEYEVPEESLVVASQWAVHRDDRWFDDPGTFDPDRWSGESDGDRPTFAFFPFGGGPRRCIGEQFARVEMKIILAAVVQSFDIELVSEERPDLAVGITTRPVDPVRIRLDDR